MNSTNHRGVHTPMEPMYRRVIFYQLNIHHKRLKGTWYLDTLISKVNSIIGNTVDNAYTQGKFVKAYYIAAQREAGQSLIGFTDYFGVPETLLTDEYGGFNGQNTKFLYILGGCACSYIIRKKVVTIRTTPHSVR